jgi:hypothetical protein
LARRLCGEWRRGRAASGDIQNMAFKQGRDAIRAYCVLYNIFVFCVMRTRRCSAGRQKPNKEANQPFGRVKNELFQKRFRQNCLLFNQQLNY